MTKEKMNKKIKNKFKHTWTHINKHFDPKEFNEQEHVLFDMMDKDGWELVQIMEMKNTYKYYFKKTL